MHDEYECAADARKFCHYCNNSSCRQLSQPCLPDLTSKFAASCFLQNEMSASSIFRAAALVVSLLATPAFVTSRSLAQAAPSAVDVYNFALNLEYLEVPAVLLTAQTRQAKVQLCTLQAVKFASPLFCGVILLRSSDMAPVVPQANFYHCAAYGTPISNNLGGPDPTGCQMGEFSESIHDFIVNLARNEMDHVTGIQHYLGMHYTAVDIGPINVELMLFISKAFYS